MGQFLVEAGSALNETVENLHYSADRACQVFPALFSTPQAAEFCETPDGAAASGCWYLAANGCLPLADAWDIDAITRRVNGEAMEAAGARRQYSDEMLSRLREYAAAAAG
jgi:predicted chitinase